MALCQSTGAVTQKTEAQKAIDEFRIQTSQLGMGANAAAHGAKHHTALEWHGRLYENLRNNFLDAVPHEVKQRNMEDALLRRNQFGFNATGPLPIPKVLDGSKNHLSLSFEGVRQRISQPYLRTVATLAERTGDFSGALNQAGQFQPIYDSRSTQVNPAYNPGQPVSFTNLQYTRDPFPGNQLPISLLDPVAKKALGYYPNPNAAVGPYNQNNYFVDPPTTNQANGLLATLDQQFTPKQELIWNAAYSDGAFGAAKLFPNAWTPGQDDQRSRDEHVQLSYVYTPSPQAVNSASFLARNLSAISGEQLTGNPAAQIGLPGVGTNAFPVFNLSPYLYMGHPSPYATRDTISYNVSDTFTMHKGEHGPQVLFQYGRYQANNLNSPNPAGSYTFSPTITGLPGVVGTGDTFASFLLGAADSAQATYISALSHFQRTDGFLGFHDHFIASKGFTIDYGVSGHFITPRISLNNQQTDIDLGLQGALVVAGENGIPRGFRPKKLFLEPSLGLAYIPAIDQHLVLRAAYHRFYQPIQMGILQNNTQGFNQYTNLVSPNVTLQPATYLSAGFPGFGALPNLSPTAANNTIADLVDMSGRLPTIQSASFSVEHLFGSNLVTGAFAYSGGKNLLVGNNAADPDALPLSALQYQDELYNEGFNRSLRPYPQFLDFNLNGNYPAGRYLRSEASVHWEKRASGGLVFDALFDISKQMDDYSGPYGKQNYSNNRSEWSLTPGNRPLTLQFNCSWELPLGEGKRFLLYKDWRRFVTSGWAIRFTGSVYSGTPLQLISEFNNTGGVATTLQVNTVPGVNASVANPGPVLWYNPAAFVQPPDFTLGNVSRTLPSILNPPFTNYDVNFGKRLPLDSRRTLEFNVLMLNALNHGNWNNPDNLIGPAYAPNTDAGHIIGSAGGRVVQLGARITF
jgi:hypothetical protein